LAGFLFEVAEFVCGFSMLMRKKIGVRITH
jgi:hypothetical protein